MALINLTDENINDLIKNKMTLFDFYADWCGPCKMLGAILEPFAAEVDDITIVKINVDLHPDLAREYGVMSVPTLVLFNNGENVGVKQGFQSKEMLMHWIQENK